MFEVSLLQSSSGWIRLRLHTDEQCLQISTSIVFNPYVDLYAWLGRIRDGQLPAILSIDEEGHGIELFTDPIDAGNVHLCVIEWPTSDNPEPLITFQISNVELVRGFCTGILDFLNSKNSWKKRSFFRSILNLNWRSLMQEINAPAIDWHHWLLAQGRSQTGNADRDLSQLSLAQHWAATLHQATCGIGRLIEQGHTEEAIELAALFKNLPIDLAFEQVQADWYAERLAQLFQQYAFYRDIVSIPGFEIPQPLWEEDHENRQRVRDQRRRIYKEYRSLRAGQLVEGSIAVFRAEHVFVKLGELHVLLPQEEISHLPPAYPEQVFRIGDRIKALVIFAHEYRMRIAISTRELEKEPGDMLKNPEKVYATAEEMAERYRKLVIERLS